MGDSVSSGEEQAAPAPERRRFKLIEVILAMVVLLGCGIVVNLMTINWQLERIEAQTKPAVVEERPRGNVWNELPSVRFAYEPYDITDEEAQTAILATLVSAKNLRALQLCAAELRAEAKAQRAVVEAGNLFPANKPYNHKPGQYTVHYGRFEARASALEAAARIAEAESIACVDTPPTNWHEIHITIPVSSGLRAVRVTDHGVLLLTTTVESAMSFKLCANSQTASGDEWAKKEVSATTETSGVLSEQDRYIVAAQYRAIGELLTGFPETKDC